MFVNEGAELRETHKGDMNWRGNNRHPEPKLPLVSHSTTQLRGTDLRAATGAVCMRDAPVPVSVRGVEGGVRPQTGGAGAPHSVQRRLQVAAPPQHGSTEREKAEKEREMKAGKDVGTKSEWCGRTKR